MKKDLDRLMEEQGLDAAVLTGSTHGNPSMVYMLNGADVSGGTVIKKRGEEAIFIHSPIERDEAVASGLKLVNVIKFNYRAIIEEKRDYLEATVELYRRYFDEFGIEGEVGFYGMGDAGRSFILLNKLNSDLTNINVRGEFDKTIFDVARGTKDAQEVEFMREVSRLTTEVMQETVEFMRHHRVENETLIQDDGSPLTIGAVKRHIRRLLSERNMEDPGGVIFSIGRDAGIGHSKGRADDPMQLGKSIVFDLFPRLANGYHFDCTRTYCLGYAPPEVEKVYQQVKDCVDAVIAASKAGVETRKLQQLTCEFFEQLGHPTVATDDSIEEGYVHSIGHGVGLAIHEEPFFSDVPTNTSVIEPGHVYTIEPGLYYPDSGGYGVRIEDVVWIDEQGQVQNLTDNPYELVVEMA